MSSQPTLVSPINCNGGAWSTSSYIHVGTDSTNTYYEYKQSINPNTQYYIAYNWSTGKWFDSRNTSDHNTFATSASATDIANATSRETSVDPAVVYVCEDATSSQNLVAQFLNPYNGTFSPPSSGGGTGTEGVALPNGSWATLADGRFAYTVGSSSPSTSVANGLYDIRVTSGATVTRMFLNLTHVENTPTTGYLSSTINDGLYELIHIGSSLNSYPITVLASITVGKRKAFCNFW